MTIAIIEKHPPKIAKTAPARAAQDRQDIKQLAAAANLEPSSREGVQSLPPRYGGFFSPLINLMGKAISTVGKTWLSSAVHECSNANLSWRYALDGASPV